MTAEKIKRSTLADFADRFAEASASSEGGLSIREVPFLTQLNLRANLSGAGLMEHVEQQLGFPLPQESNTVSSKGNRCALWLGPDEWLIVGPEGQQEQIETALRSAFAHSFGSICDVSANRTVIEICGPQARELLAHSCSIDLHRRHFGSGRCAQTLLAKALVVIQQVDDNPTFHLFVQTSLAWHVAEWLLDCPTAHAAWKGPHPGAVPSR